MKYVRLYAGSDGETHWQDLEMDMGPVEGRQGQGAAWPVKQAFFLERDALSPQQLDWHHAPARQFVVMLSGEAEYEASDGERRRLGAGDVMLVEDTTGKGHRAYYHGPRLAMHIPLAD